MSEQLLQAAVQTAVVMIAYFSKAEFSYPLIDSVTNPLIEGCDLGLLRIRRISVSDRGYLEDRCFGFSSYLGLLSYNSYPRTT